MRHFVWDEQKAQVNLRKHRVSFESATQVFSDPYAFSAQDRIESGEYRWQTLGAINGVTLLLVAHTLEGDLDGVELIRIVSARRADPKERIRYEQNRQIRH